MVKKTELRKSDIFIIKIKKKSELRRSDILFNKLILNAKRHKKYAKSAKKKI